MDKQLTPEQEYNRAYYQKNKAKYIQRYRKNKKRINARTVKRRKKNPEPYRSYQKQWRASNPDKCKAYSAQRSNRKWKDFINELMRDIKDGN